MYLDKKFKSHDMHACMWSKNGYSNGHDIGSKMDRI